ncbi:MAG: hypothetical protein BWK78_08175, partial [Thiotrichaceae bacterium IS1]
MKATFEVDVKVAEQTKRVLVDSDGDGVADEFDAFPNDAKEWMDSDHDKVGNNADTDDDGDGMPDEWEKQYNQLHSTRYDADGDADKDGVSNLDEYKAGTNPMVADSESSYTASGKLFAEPNMPLAGATIQIGDKTTVTDKLGNWQIDGLTNGNYTATATKNGYTIPTQNVVVNGENLTFDLGVVYSAHGTIKDEQKQPVAGITITIGDQHTQTDATGYWKLDGLPAGESTLIAS